MNHRAHFPKVLLGPHCMPRRPVLADARPVRVQVDTQPATKSLEITRRLSSNFVQASMVKTCCDLERQGARPSETVSRLASVMTGRSVRQPAALVGHRFAQR